MFDLFTADWCLRSSTKLKTENVEKIQKIFNDNMKNGNTIQDILYKYKFSTVDFKSILFLYPFEIKKLLDKMEFYPQNITVDLRYNNTFEYLLSELFKGHLHKCCACNKYSFGEYCSSFCRNTETAIRTYNETKDVVQYDDDGNLTAQNMSMLLEYIISQVYINNN